MQKGWKAAGLLQPLWGSVGGRERLAEITGINTSTLSGINTGRLNLGPGNARKIAAALEVSVLELGAPIEAADEAGQTLLDRLLELAATVDDQQTTIDLLEKRMAGLERARRAPAKPRRASGGG